ncbi:hypothetical protein Dred_1809 [Desulforamulus reducens MI-1]|uniref:Uncharacterized protein n=1 Tax=Desulforamulus reducens (strain ATCC BAA-1160 / DSM 100696 / MI-1) TaxID=349161 RepID=A4J5I1_DESRM|nr:hypothetical protein [Desulforamulus reducens]ABO50334.1 hypothetical protein Dred_1809 [Desulforamulus reducens MI-1]
MTDNTSKKDCVLGFIQLIKETAPKEMTRIFTQGGCYRFHLILKVVFPEAKPYKVGFCRNPKQMGREDFIPLHVISKIGNRFYDINGEFKLKNQKRYNILAEMTEADINQAEKFSFVIKRII